MARRTIATVRRPAAHIYVASVDVPGVCRDCGLPKANSVHEVPDVHAAQDEHRRRAGEQE